MCAKSPGCAGCRKLGAWRSNSRHTAGRVNALPSRVKCPLSLSHWAIPSSVRPSVRSSFSLGMSGAYFRIRCGPTLHGRPFGGLPEATEVLAACPCASRADPSFMPRALAAARAFFVRSLISRASSWATAAKMCSVKVLAPLQSQHTKSTFDSINAAVNATLRASRSNLATTKVALASLAWAMAFASSGRSGFLPVSISV